MSLTSYRAAPPRVKNVAGKRPARRLCSNGATAWEGLACLPSRARIARLPGAGDGSIFMRKAGVRADLPVGEGLAGAARGILHEARDALEDRARPQAAAVHEYRKDMKRWRAMLRLLAPFLGTEGDGLQREARDLARELAPARDAQAALDALADLGKGDAGLPAAMTKALRSRIEKIKASETTALDDDLRRKLGGALDTAEHAAGRWPFENLGFAEIASALVSPLWPRMTKAWIAEAQRLRDRLRSHPD